MKCLTKDWYALLCRGAASKRGGRIFWLTLAAFVLALNLYAPAQPTVAERVLASAIILLAFAAIWRWTYHGRGIAEFGFLPGVLIVYSLEYSLTIFTIKQYSMDFWATLGLPDEVVEKALLLALAGLICILCGYYHPGRRTVAKVLPRINMHWRDKRAVQLVSAGFAAIGLFVFVILFRTNLADSVQAYANLPGDFFYLAIIALFFLQLEGELSFGYKAVLWTVLMPLRMLIGMASGYFASAMIVVMALVIVYATVRRRIPWLVFIAGFGAFLIMQPVKGSLRQSVFVNGQTNRNMNDGEKIGALADSTQRGMEIVGTLDFVDVVSIATQRLNDIIIFATVANSTPQNIPYWGGSTYYRMLFVPIPRIIYPEKPNELPGNVFGHTYGVLPSGDATTSINLTQLIELYGNFGPLGVILGCILIGMIYRTVNDTFMHEGCGLGAIVAGAYLFTHLVDIENASSPVFGGLLLETATVVIFHCGVRFVEGFFVALDQRRAARREPEPLRPRFAGPHQIPEG